MRISPRVTYLYALKYRNASFEVAHLQIRDIVFIFNSILVTNERRTRAIHKITVVQSLTNLPRLRLTDVRIKTSLYATASLWRRVSTSTRYDRGKE